ncbi:hypothetical protein AAC387_Pa01g0755 [Persea americana]
MAGLGYEPPVCVAGDVFCVRYNIDLVVRKKIKGLSEARYEVFDIHGRLLLQVHGGLWSLQRKRVMRDAAGFPILSIQEKPLTWHHRWTVFQGDGSNNPGNLLFSVQRSHGLQLKTELDVFLPSNFREDTCNFHLTGRYLSESCRVYKGDSIIAEVNHKFTWSSLFEGKDNFVIRVYPGIDYAFIVALIVILHEINSI